MAIGIFDASFAVLTCPSTAIVWKARSVVLKTIKYQDTHPSHKHRCKQLLAASEVTSLLLFIVWFFAGCIKFKRRCHWKLSQVVKPVSLVIKRPRRLSAATPEAQIPAPPEPKSFYSSSVFERTVAMFRQRKSLVGEWALNDTDHSLAKLEPKTDGKVVRALPFLCVPGVEFFAVYCQEFTPFHVW